VPLYHDSALDGARSRMESRRAARAAAARPRSRKRSTRSAPRSRSISSLVWPDDRTLYPGLEKQVLAELERRGWLARTLFSSFYDEALARLRAAEPRARIGLLLARRSAANMFERSQRLGAEALHPARSLVTPELVDESHRLGLRVHVFTVDDTDDQRRLLDWGVDGVFTNGAHARDLTAALDRRGRDRSRLRLASLRDRPDHERLSLSHVARGVDAWDAVA
jgi:hypothetical protein